MNVPPENPAPSNKERSWLRDAVRHRGVLGALGAYATSFVEFLRDLTPERRRSRYGDIDYDFDHGVNTTWANVGLRTRLREWLRGVQYQASEPQLFGEILDALPVPPDGLTFIDLGSGKGRTLLMAAERPFARVIGVELLPELNAIAQQNIAAYKSEAQYCFALESHAGDARDFKFSAEPLVLYLFNPFPEYVLRDVLKHLHASLLEFPRDIFVIYHNLVLEQVFAEQLWLRAIHRTHQFAIYRAVTND